jgi:molybdopterin-dependent oxidoreductase alpha subunit
MKRKVSIIPPEKLADLKIKPKKKKAAGIPAVMASLEHLKKELGVAKGMKMLNKMNQKGGFDCAGCAWPDPDGKRSKLGEYCENGAKALAEEATNKRVDPAFFEKHSVEEMSTWTDYTIGKSGRITQPMYLAADSSHYKAIAWTEAYNIIGQHFKALSTPDEAVFYTSGRTSNEAAFMYQLFARQWGTNNLPDCSNMCHESSGKGLSQTVGIGKGSVTLEDLHLSELIVVIGQNPGTNHPRMLSALAKCKKNGGKVVSVNPIPEAGLECFVDPQNIGSVLGGGQAISDQYLQVKINGDIALLKASLWLMLEAEKKQPGTVFDLDFIEQNCAGYEALIDHIEQTDYALAVQESGVPEPKIRAFAQLLIQHKKIIICWAMGITQHENGVENVREIVNILLLKGAIGKEGAGTCPVRGHSNVQGDRTMGIWEAPKEAFLKNLDKRFAMQAPRQHGYDVVHAIKAMAENRVRVFVAMGGNFVSATPDSQFTGEAVQNCDLTVQISTKLNRSHLITGKEALILPCLSRSEKDLQATGPQFVSVENSMGVVHSSQGSFAPASPHLMSEPSIVANIAKTVLEPDAACDWSEMARNYDRIREHIEAVIPGFEQYNQRVRIPEGFYLPNGARKKIFNTASGKAQLTINPMPNRRVQPGHFILMTIRTHDQYNTTIYGMNDRYRGIVNERRVAFMNLNDMQQLGLSNHDIIHFKSYFKGATREAHYFKVVAYDIAQGCIATYFPETNCLVHLDNKAKESHTPASKFIEVEVIVANKK